MQPETERADAPGRTAHFWGDCCDGIRVVMRQDAKLGLALGMLAIGFAVAFCFPRQQQFDHGVQLEAQRTAQSEPTFLPIREHGPSATGTVEERLPETRFPDPDPSQDVDEAERVARAGLVSPAPRSSDRSPRDRRLVDLLDSDPGILNPDEPSLIQTEGVPSSVSPSGDSRHKVEAIYTVRAGDTLTGIATRLWGNTRRYLELYEANRDQLTTPDALQIGMRLRIPGEADDDAQSNESSSSPNIADSNSADGAENDDDRRFRRPRRTPFLSEGAGTASSPSAPRIVQSVEDHPSESDPNPKPALRQATAAASDANGSHR